MKKCPVCLEEYLENYKYCIKCGAQLEIIPVDGKRKKSFKPVIVACLALCAAAAIAVALSTAVPKSTAPEITNEEVMNVSTDFRYSGDKNCFVIGDKYYHFISDGDTRYILFNFDDSIDEPMYYASFGSEAETQAARIQSIKTISRPDLTEENLEALGYYCALKAGSIFSDISDLSQGDRTAISFEKVKPAEALLPIDVPNIEEVNITDKRFVNTQNAVNTLTHAFYLTENGAMAEYFCFPDRDLRTQTGFANTENGDVHYIYNTYNKVTEDRMTSITVTNYRKKGQVITYTVQRGSDAGVKSVDFEVLYNEESACWTLNGDGSAFDPK